MSQAQELVNTLLDSYNRNDLDLLKSLLTEDVRHTAQGSDFSADMEGAQKYVDHMGFVLSNFQSITFTPYKTHVDPTTNTIISEWDGEFVTANGVPYSSKGILILETVDGKISWVREHFDTEKTKQAMSS